MLHKYINTITHNQFPLSDVAGIIIYTNDVKFQRYDVKRAIITLLDNK